METKKMLSILVLAGLLVFSVLVVAGDLEPSGPPGPTMKTLDEVEPRIPIQSLSGSAGAMYVIDRPGSYYLTSDVNVVDPNKNGINVDSNDVTIDLAGFALVGSGSGYGIYLKDRNNVEIRNGTVRNFWQGIYDHSNYCRSYRVIGVRAVYNAINGISIYGRGHLVKDCTAANNGSSATSSANGIIVGGGSTVTGNTACYNGLSATSWVCGIVAGTGSTITGNTAYYNGVYASGDVAGIYADPSCTVTGNTAYENGQSTTGTHVYGIYTDSGCTVTGNTACDNGLSATGSVYGIYLGGNNLVDQNTAYNNDGTNMNNPGNCTFGVNRAP